MNAGQPWGGDGRVDAGSVVGGDHPFSGDEKLRR
jgi:hypothetical protein